MRYPDSLTGHLRPILKPRESNDLDWEAELAVIIGKGGGRIPEEEALAHVAGYTAFNDGSVRDWQFHTRQIAPGNNFRDTEIGRASCRERVCKYVEISLVAVVLKQKITLHKSISS